jgi:colanic acid/amylovoran biosynthesis glycosyltransferase
VRIAFIVNQFPALSETFVLRQVTGLLDRGHEVDVFFHSPSPEPFVHSEIDRYRLRERAYPLTRYPASTVRLVRGLQRLALLASGLRQQPRATLKSLNPLRFGGAGITLRALSQIAPFFDKGPYDIVHCQFGSLGDLGLLLRDTGVCQGKIVTSFRGYDVAVYQGLKGRRRYADLFARGDLFLCVSERIRHQLVALGCDQRKIVVHRSGTSIKTTLGRLQRNGQPTRILTVCRLVAKKGVEYGIRAVAQLLKNQTQLEYIIAGDGPLRNALDDLMRQLRVGDGIKLLGWKSQDEIVELLKSSDIVLVPSVTSANGDEEGIPGIIMEAFAQGVPVVSTRHAGIPEVVHESVSGFLVPEREAGALADRLQYLADRPQLRSQMGREGQRFVARHCDIERLNDQLEGLYRTLLDGGSPAFHSTDRKPHDAPEIV